jgi:hypothetical protein
MTKDVKASQMAARQQRLEALRQMHEGAADVVAALEQIAKMRDDEGLGAALVGRHSAQGLRMIAYYLQSMSESDLRYMELALEEAEPDTDPDGDHASEEQRGITAALCPNPGTTVVVGRAGREVARHFLPGESILSAVNLVEEAYGYDRSLTFVGTEGNGPTSANVVELPVRELATVGGA